MARDTHDDPPNRARRQFLAAGAGSLIAVRGFAHDESTIARSSARIAAGELAAPDLLAAYLEGIAAIDRAGPRLRAVIELKPEARALGQGGALQGMPILVKDNIATADGMATTAGSLALDGYRAAQDAPLVTRLREAGAVIFGKTNLSEWANFRSTNSVSGWSSRGGQTRNPYALDRSPSGSSSGSAVAVAANLCAAAIGTETDGSITSPAACNNIVGFKPTLGLVSQAGIVPIAHSQDTAGPLARSVEDCARVMNVINTSASAIDFTAHLGMKDLKGVRIGVGRQFFGTNEKADRVIEEALAALKDLGAVLVDVEFPTLGKFEESELEVLFFEFKADLNQWLANADPPPPVASLVQLIGFNARNAERVMPIFGQDLFVKAQEHGPITSPRYRAALAKCRRLTRKEGIDAVMKKHRVEAIAALTSPPAWLIDPVNGDSARGGCTSLPAVAGYPHVTVPAGFAAGLPVGLSLFGGAHTDARLLGIAQVYEKATRHRIAPTFVSTATITAGQ